MQRLFWIGSPFFYPALAGAGFTQTAFHNFEDERVFGWDDIVRLAGFEPDVLVVSDKSRPPFVLGVENFPCLTIFYSVDSHIHSWQPAYAQAFDACLVSLKDDLPAFAGPFLPPERIFWSPPFAKDGDTPPEKPPARKWDCLFVGNVNENTPKRAAFLRELGRRLPGLERRSGDYRSLFPRGRVLLNHCERGDLNFRVFEAMGMGGCLVTPRIGNGQHSLFVDGEHFVEYVPDDAGDALFRIRLLLENPELRAYIGATALQEINARHRAIHRAQAFSDKLCDLWSVGLDALVQARLARSAGIRNGCLRMPYLLWASELESEALKKSYLEAACPSGGSK